MSDELQKVRITEKGRAVFRELQKYPESERPRILHEMLHEECRGQDPCYHGAKDFDPAWPNVIE